MSKIQDALRRIQEGSRPSARKRIDTLETQVATVIMEQAVDNLAGAEKHDSRVVAVDRKLLREAGLLPPEDQERYIADQYRIIKRPILDLATDKFADKPLHSNLVMIASALPGDGKTFNAINIALSMAVERDTSVLLVDADIAKPHISDLFGLQSEPGLIDVLVDQNMSIQDVIIRSDVPGLSLLPAGRADEHATELLASRRMARFATELSESVPNRIVIFDSPPLLVTSESRVLASNMGQVAMVVCAGKTPQHAVISAISSLDEGQAVNLILNQAGSTIGDMSYGQFQYGYGERISVRH